MMRALTWVDRLLVPLDRLALVFLAILGAAVVMLALDRKPPFSVVSVEPAAARPGQVVVIRARVKRDAARHCSARFSRYVFDTEATRWYIDSGTASPDMIERMESRTPGLVAFAFRVPEAARPGPATLTTVLDYACNKVQLLWPIQVTAEFDFDVLPP